MPEKTKKQIIKILHLYCPLWVGDRIQAALSLWLFLQLNICNSSISWAWTCQHALGNNIEFWGIILNLEQKFPQGKTLTFSNSGTREQERKTNRNREEELMMHLMKRNQNSFVVLGGEGSSEHHGNGS